MATPRPDPLIDRELSWLAFNHRVLQEAADPTVPLYDRLDFLAIFSSNLDEFFRVRVAALRALLRNHEPDDGREDDDLPELLREIHRVVVDHQTEFGRILRDQIVPALAAAGVHLSDGVPVDEEERAGVGAQFEALVREQLTPMAVVPDAAPFLKNRAIYLVVELGDGGGRAGEYALVEVPSGIPRFLVVEHEGAMRVWFTDDVIRLHLRDLFTGCLVGESYAVKMTRDASLYLDQEFSEDIADAVRRSLSRRESGLPSRFLFDQAMPGEMLAHLSHCYQLANEDLVRGGRYHNLHDLHSFPRVEGEGLSSEPLPPIPHPVLDGAPSILDAVARRDHLLHFPYQGYEPVLRFLEEAATDPRVSEMSATLYRVARESRVVEALVRAARNGKQVTAVVEVQARFDEDANLRWAEQLKEAGVRTIYGVPGLKVHAKLLLVRTHASSGLPDLACLSTGNFNERTSRIYADHALLTARPELTREVSSLFDHLAGEIAAPSFESLMVAPFELRGDLASEVERVAAAARRGEHARIVLKMNSLEDPGMIDLLYRAGREGVEIQLIVRGICCLAAGEQGISEGIAARSIVDRFLEHARIFLFEAGSDTRLYLASSDWMRRNLDRRIEVAFPILDPELRSQLLAILDLQLSDNRKARRLDARMSNEYLRDDRPEIRAQLDTHRMLTGASRAGERSPASEPAVGPSAETHR